MKAGRVPYARCTVEGQSVLLQLVETPEQSRALPRITDGDPYAEGIRISTDPNDPWMHIEDLRSFAPFGYAVERFFTTSARRLLEESAPEDLGSMDPFLVDATEWAKAWAKWAEHFDPYTDRVGNRRVQLDLRSDLLN